ncbi:MAG TPA: rod shape-determining protein MreD [Tissierellia bacterium]|mgnify:CR=1 FL=1|nr:rod shape-determining protein MreD [Tissierellia bacterium]
MSILALVLIIIINFILQTTIVPYFSILDVVPNTSLIVVVIIAILNGKRVGAVCGLIIGLLQDIMFAMPLGINPFIYFFAGYLIGMTENKLSRESVLLPIFMTILSTIGYHLLYYLFTFFLGYEISIVDIMKDIVLVETIYNTLLSILLFKLLSRFFHTPSIRFSKK